MVTPGTPGIMAGHDWRGYPTSLMGGGLQELILGDSLGVSELVNLLCPHIPLLVTQSTAVGSLQECPDLSKSVFLPW